MHEILASILAGAFSGAAVVAYLSKKLVENQLSKTLKKYQHELDVKKDMLATDLSLHASLKNLKLTKLEETRREAIHNIYNAIILTSMSRVGFQKMIGVENCKNNDQFCTLYFDTLSKNYEAFSSAYQAISAAYDCIEKESIYIEASLEKDVKDCLGVIHETYVENHDILKAAHDEIKVLSAKGQLNRETAPFDMDAFHDKSMAIWTEKTAHARENLKGVMRNLLST